MNTPKQTANLKKEILIRLIKAYLSDNFEENVKYFGKRIKEQKEKGKRTPGKMFVNFFRMFGS